MAALKRIIHGVGVELLGLRPREARKAERIGANRRSGTEKQSLMLAKAS